MCFEVSCHSEYLGLVTFRRFQLYIGSMPRRCLAPGQRDRNVHGFCSTSFLGPFPKHATWLNPIGGPTSEWDLGQHCCLCQLKIAGKTTEANCPRCLYWYSQLPPRPSTTTCVYHLKIHLVSGKLRWQWKMDPLKMYFRLNMGIFHSYVSLPESNSRQLSKALTASPNIGHSFCLGQVGAFRVESVEHGEIVFFSMVLVENG